MAAGAEPTTVELATEAEEGGSPFRQSGPTPTPRPSQTRFQRWNPLSMGGLDPVTVRNIFILLTTIFCGVQHHIIREYGNGMATPDPELCPAMCQKSNEHLHSICETMMHQKYEENRECLFRWDNISRIAFRQENKLGRLGETINQLQSENFELKREVEKLKLKKSKWNGLSWFSWANYFGGSKLLDGDFLMGLEADEYY